MTPPRVTRGDRLTALHAYSNKKCRCGRVKVRDVEAICKDCFVKLPEPMRRGLKDPELFPAVYTEACKFLHIW